MDSDHKQLTKGMVQETFDQQHVNLPQQNSTLFVISQPPAYDGPAAAYLPQYPISRTQEQINQTTVALSQPGSLTPMEPPPNHLALAIFTTLCCCVPLGILAIIKSVQVDKAVQRGDAVTAEVASQRSRKYSNLGIIFGIMFCISFAFFNFMRSLSH